MMGWIGFPVDMGVAITGAIIIGVAIDDTIHFLVKYFELREQNVPVEKALDQVLSYIGKAIIFTTVVLSVSFSMFIFSDFVPNQNFGMVTAAALVIALLVDLLFLPALLALAEEKHIRRENEMDKTAYYSWVRAKYDQWYGKSR
jgi:predicted RND superfamily exporter protein